MSNLDEKRKLREYGRTVEIFCRAVIISMNIHNEPCRKNGRRDRSIPRRKFRGNNDRLPFPSARGDRARGDLTQDTAQTHLFFSHNP